jgi:hypothetical protein
MTLWRALNRWGFNHGEGRRRDSLKEQNRVILARRKYLWAKLANRNPDGTLKRSEVYLDETYINKNHSCRFTWYLKEDGPIVNKPSGVGPRLILVHAITEDGWVDGAQLVFEAKKRKKSILYSFTTPSLSPSRRSILRIQLTSAFDKKADTCRLPTAVI